MLELPFEPPIQQLNLTVFAEHNIEVFVKREDMIHPFISGNKWRKLKYVLEDAKNEHKNTLVSFGGAYSNHLVALACAGAMYGFKTYAFVRGEEVENPLLGICKTYGMELVFVDRASYKKKELLYATIANNDTYFIDEGGKGKLAAKGCEEILDSVSEMSHIVCAIGTGTTFAGLINGCNNKQIKAQGICVLKGAEGINDDIKALVNSNADWEIFHQFHGGGYAKTTPQLFAFIDDVAAQTGILFDQVYTAKALFAITQLAQQNYYKSGDKVLLIHTGGLLGLQTRWIK